jgi:hypothetical protein
MSKIIIYLGSLLIVVNTIIGLLISKYLLFNWLSVDVVLIINTILIFKLSSDNISNGYKISLSFIYPVLCVVSLVLAILSPNKFNDNYYVIAFILILLIEISLYLIAKNLKLINNIK